MKTTVAIPEVVFRETKDLARECNWTLPGAVPMDEKEVLALSFLGTRVDQGCNLSCAEIRDRIYGLPPERT